MKKLGLYVLVGLGLSACAGGMTTGGSLNNKGVKQNVVTQYPVETALLNIYTRPRSEKLYGDGNSQFNAIEFIVVPKASTTFEGKRVQSAEMTVIAHNDDETEKFATVHYFSVNPAIFYGFTNSLGEYSIANQTSKMPKLAEVGTSSELITETVYADSSKRKMIDRYTQSWSLSQAGPQTAWFCIATSKSLLVADMEDSATKECHKINADGDILASKLSYLPPAGSSEPSVTYFSR